VTMGWLMRSCVLLKALPGMKALLVLLSLIGAPLPAMAEPRRPLKPAAPNPSRHFFYEISSREGGGWLFGSIHVGDHPQSGGDKIYPLPKSVLKAFSRSGVLAVELNPENISAINPVVTRPKVPAASVLSDIEMKKLSRLVPRLVHSEDICLVSLEAQQMALMTLRDRLQGGVDKYFMGKARVESKKILELETLAIQLDALVFNKLSQTQAKDFCGAQIKSILSEKDIGAATELELKKLIRMWKAGDDGGVEDLFLHADLKDVPAPTRDAAWKILGPDRNALMTAGILKELRAGQKIFVVVGAAHLVGRDSIVDMLRSRGVKIRRL